MPCGGSEGFGYLVKRTHPTGRRHGPRPAHATPQPTRHASRSHVTRQAVGHAQARRGPRATRPRTGPTARRPAPCHHDVVNATVTRARPIRPTPNTTQNEKEIAIANTHGPGTRAITRVPTARFTVDARPEGICELGGLRAVMSAVLTVTCLCLLSVSVCCAVSTSSNFDCLPCPVCVSLSSFVRRRGACASRAGALSLAVVDDTVQTDTYRLALGSLRVSSMPPTSSRAIPCLSEAFLPSFLPRYRARRTMDPRYVSMQYKQATWRNFPNMRLIAISTAPLQEAGHSCHCRIEKEQ